VIPIKDNIPTRRLPIVTIALIVANFAMFFLFQHANLKGNVSQANTVRYALIPYRLTHPGKACGTTATLAGNPQPQTAQEPVCEGQTVPVQTPAGESTDRVKTVSPDNQPPAILTIFTSMFMHGGWLHILGNMLFLWIFGNNVEDSMGRPRFILFYLLGGIIAALGQTLIHPSSAIPTLGASGATAAVLGGYALLFPRARVITVVIIIFFFTLLELPALLVLGLWFALQALTAATTANLGGGGVAYFAHIGGFLFGLLAIKLFANRYDPNYDRPNRLPVY
jgi:membrane associated rhomboid family serine protease